MTATEHEKCIAAHLSVFGPGLFFKAGAMCLERSVVASEFIHDVIPSLGALSFFPSEWTGVCEVLSFPVSFYQSTRDVLR